MISKEHDLKKPESKRDKPIPQAKKVLVDKTIELINDNKTVLLASSKGLPGQQFHEIKKKLRDKAFITVTKKSIILRAIDKIDKGAIKNMKKLIGSDIVLFFSNIDCFELSGILSENQSPAKAKSGDIAPENIEIEAGPTDLPPGPAISELGSVGLKVSVKDGKLEIMKGAMVVKKGEEIKENVASVLGKLDISPMRVGFLPIAAYDSESDRVYENIIIDKERTLQTLREIVAKSLGLAVSIAYPTKMSVKFLISKAAMEEKALSGAMGTDSPKIDQVKESKTQESIESKEDEKIPENKDDSPIQTEDSEQKSEDNQKDTKEDN